MNRYEDASKDHELRLSLLHRTQGIADLPGLLSRRRVSCISDKRSSTPNSRRSESHESENSQMLFMSASKTLKTRRETCRSRCSIGNNVDRRLDGCADGVATEQEKSENTISRHVIDGEISEWQYVCQSGRPYWWSTHSKYARLQKLQQRMSNEQDWETRMYAMKTPQPQLDVRRAAVSDSYLSDPTTVHDLAHLIAVQLLGACFTLPPDSITAVTPEYTRDEGGGSILKDTRLISSLRMHTQFRYSPSFGHQARNTSPVQLWPGRFDGPSPIRSNTGFSTPNIGTSSPCSGRHRAHRALHNTEGSANAQDRDDDEDYIRTCCSNNESDTTSGPSAWYSREGVNDSHQRSFTFSHMPGATNRHHPTHTPEPSKEEHNVGKSGSRAPKTNYRLQPVIRSEPHHVFIQPVRELVVKRWRNFRRRFSGSLHSSLPTATSEDADSESGSEISTPLLSTSPKARRLRAQERGDIHSSSVDSAPHYNTPMSGNLSPNNNELAQSIQNDSQNPTPTFRLADPLAAAASLVAAERTRLQSSGPSSPVTPTESVSSIGYGRSMASSALATCGTSNVRSEISVASKLNTPSSTYSFTSQRSLGRPRRRSMLSEVCTPEDFPSSEPGDRGPPFDRSVLSAMGSALPSPKDEIKPGYPFGRRQIDHVVSSPGPTILPTLGELRVSVPERPRFSRTSTSGTQVFTPNEYGVEIDGLPVGPARDQWGVKGSRRERTYL